MTTPSLELLFFLFGHKDITVEFPWAQNTNTLDQKHSHSYQSYSHIRWGHEFDRLVHANLRVSEHRSFFSGLYPSVNIPYQLVV